MAMHPSPIVDFSRDECTRLALSARREWLITNGIGGYAMGSVAGIATRSYHGYLAAALQPPVGRWVLMALLAERVQYDGASYELMTQHRADGVIAPSGYLHLDRFHLEGTTPVWTYACADALLEKRLWMQPGANTTYVRYTVRRASRPLDLHCLAFGTHRDHHATTPRNLQLIAEAVTHGVRIEVRAGAPYYLLSAAARITPHDAWTPTLFLEIEAYRGQPAYERWRHIANAVTTLNAGESVTFVISTEPEINLDGAAAWAEREAYEQTLLARASAVIALDEPAIRQLVLAADQFIVARPLPDGSEGRSVIDGYPWFGDWGRDTMISLAGLTLVTGRAEIARQILRTFAAYLDQGMLPNRFPDAGEAPEYNTADATLWYFEAVRAYDETTGDASLVAELFPALADIIDWHLRGTRYQIRVDPTDGLLAAGEPGVQLTWMDAKVADWVVTPRIGKPVEINALWYHALCLAASWAQRLGDAGRAEYCATLAGRVQRHFSRFWNDELGYCFDVIDGPDGDDATLRPNQLLAASLAHSPLSLAQQRAIVDICVRRLLTPHGLRSLTADHPAYEGRYGGDRWQRDAAYHQGTVWSWLIGPFVSAHLRVYGDPATARSYLSPLLAHIKAHGVGSISEIFDGDAPFEPRGCIAQAWGVAEVLRAWHELQAFEDDRQHSRLDRR